MGRGAPQRMNYWEQWLGVAHGVSDLACLSIGTDEGAVLTGALAYDLRSSLDIVLANDGRSALARA
jgi:hypothetical protein